MRLYLSSERLGSAPQELVRLLRGRTRVGVVADAAYRHDPVRRAARIRADLTDLRALRLEPVELDLAELGDDVDALWVLGGDVLALRAALVDTGADDVVRRRLAEDSLVYAGYSAGACVLGPHLPLPEPDGSAGLGVIPFTVLPHHGSDRADGLRDLFVEQHIPFIALRDGEAVVVEGDGLRVVGSPAPRS